MSCACGIESDRVVGKMELNCLYAFVATFRWYHDALNAACGEMELFMNSRTEGSGAKRMYTA